MSRHVWRRLCLWAALLTASVGCASADDLAGVWRGAPEANNGDLLFAQGQTPVGVELVLGQYGPDLAGVVRWWSSADFLVERSAEAPDNLCACGLVRNGRVSASGDRATFWLQSCLPGASTTSTVRTRVELLLLNSGTQLQATFTVDDAAASTNGKHHTVTLTRTLTSDELTSEQLRCEPPAVGGNGSSGQ